MFRGLPASIVLHAAVIGAGYVVLPSLSRPVPASVEIVPIELVTISDTTNIAPRIEREVPEEPEEPPRLEDYLDDVDSIPDEAIVEEDVLAAEQIVPEAETTEPVIIPDEPLEEEPEPEPEPEDTSPKPEPDRPLLEPEPEVDPLDNILGDASNLFDRTPRDQSKSPPPPPDDTELEDEQPGATQDRRGAGDQSGNTASVIAMIQAQMFVCWTDVDDLPNPERLNVTVRIVLNRDGTLKEDARLVNPARPPIGDRAMGVAIDRALRAVRTCAPYRLPEEAQDNYDDWDEVTLNIGPAFRQ
ncbi:MAG: hypothetical protein AAF216_10400 [Pseudomonadota bacterium]